MGKSKDRTPEHGGASRVYLTRISDRKPLVRIAEGGRLLEVKTAKIEEKKGGIQKEWIYVPSQGTFDRGHLDRVYSMFEEKRGGGLRGDINDFSADSRRRLQRKLATINEFETDLPDFLTLTYPGEYSVDWREWKRHLHNFNKALVRRWPQIWGLWRMEFQERGAPHFHFLLWDGPRVVGIQAFNTKTRKMQTVVDRMNEHNRAVFDWMSESWFRIVGSGDRRHLAAGTRIEPIQTWNGVQFYASKYLAKLPEGGFVPSEYEGTGRFWGVLGKSRWKSTFLEEQVNVDVFFRIKRVVRKRLEKKGIDPWRMRIAERADNGFSTMIDSRIAKRLLDWAVSGQAYCPF
jgi:hypothetical protein